MIFQFLIPGLSFLDVFVTYLVIKASKNWENPVEEANFMGKFLIQKLGDKSFILMALAIPVFWFFFFSYAPAETGWLSLGVYITVLYSNLLTFTNKKEKEINLRKEVTENKAD